MKKNLIAVVILGLLLSLIVPVSASTGLSMSTWVHTSDGMGVGSPAIYPDTFAIAFSPNYATDNTVYTGTYIGVHKSTDRGLTWTNKMAATQPAISSLSISPTDPTGNTMIAGTPDGTIGIFQTTNRWDNFSGIGPAGLAVSFAVYSPDYVHDHMIYAGTIGNGIRALINNTPPWW